ncbi:uncharacterized protein LOC113643538 [Tachysurus fulvidraco]|uniref:uncharacterized protein LOC113643538 n=1 Tax=Tachysurus fulvidraco TaxID=1234273 RepID=UPI001FF072EA|nr:uncharacterized protein LOC113643538 [Tachysurus fulvidraco]XP_027003642.2 uncharacterized protein LOC113643538 [Tachysurus fulvidraco]XP_027003643.2 uncharacterized protein LOC113643538 [Tachysurus fulvidraco]
MPQKTKRLKTIKQRNQIRRQNSTRSNQHHQHCERRSKDKRPCSECQDCSCLHKLSIKEKPFAKPFPTQKPSIITEGRLTSIRGLFSHEVRSVDIERLVKEKKHQKHTEKHETQATASNSPSPSCVIPHSTPPAVIAETSENSISACTNKEKIHNLQTNLEETDSMTMHSEDENHRSNQTSKATDNTARSASPPGQKGIQEAVILSSSENDSAQKPFQTSFKVTLNDHKAIPKKKNTHIQKQTKKTIALMDVQPDFVNSERLCIPVDAPQFNPSPTIVPFPSPRLDRKISALRDESLHSKPVFSSKDEAVSRITARLCRELSPFPVQRCCPLLTDCSEVLLQHLHERHGSQLHHNLHRLQSLLSVEGLQSSQPAKKVWPRNDMQKYLDNTHLYFSYTRKHEDDQPKEIMELQTDNRLQNEGYCENVDMEAASKRQRKQTWGIYSPQNFVTKQPCKDTLSQWNLTAQSQESLTAKQHSKSQTFSLHQAFSRSQTSTPMSCTGEIFYPFFLEPQKQVQLSTGENRRHNTALPLLEQWRNDPDLNFLFQDENLTRTHTSLDPLTELKNHSPDHNIEIVNERTHFGASSTVSAFFPPEGFCYEPYYRFPHPSNSFKRSEISSMSLYTQPDVEKRGLGPSLHSTNPYL